MDKDRIKGAADQAKGNLKIVAGKVLGAQPQRHRKPAIRQSRIGASPPPFVFFPAALEVPHRQAAQAVVAVSPRIAGLERTL